MIRACRSRIIRNLLLFIPTILLITILSFSVVYFAPGDAATMLLRDRLDRTDIRTEQAEEFREQMGLKGSFFELYSQWLQSAVKGDFGISLSTGKSVHRLFWSKYKITLTLALCSIFLEMVLSFAISLYAGTKPGGLADRLVSVWSVVTCSIPSFWLALITVWFLSVQLQFSAAIGYRGIQSLFLPAFIMAFISSGNLARIIRHKTREIMSMPYVEFAFAQGMNLSKILRHHVMPHILPSAISIIVLDISSFIGGAVIVESIFNIPGFSGILQKAISVKDYNLLSGSLFYIATMICGLNLLADAIYPTFDQRNKSELYTLKQEQLNE